MEQVTPYVREWASGLWRSEDMVLAQLTFQRELAHASIHELGQLGICQFLDLNGDLSAFQREYTRDVRRCEESERKLRGFREQLETVAQAKGRTRIRVDPLAVVDADPPVQSLDDLDRRLQEIDDRLTEKQTRYMQLLEQRNRTIQYLEILDCTGDFLRASSTDFPVGTRSETNLQYLTGVIQTSKLFHFERAIHRASRGNFFIRKRPIVQPLEDPKTLELVNYTVFVVFFAAQRVYDVVRKLADSVGAVVYDVPTPAAAEAARIDLRAEQESHDHAQAAWEDELGALLSLISGNIAGWERLALSEKLIAQTLNLCRFSGSMAMAEAWVPKKRLRELRDALAHASHLGSAQVESLIRVVPTTKKHPTYFDTNRFTSNFQQIVDSYGIATYKEVNPGVMTIVTFPFLFGIMYGDIGHGVMMFVLALLLVLFEKTLAKIDSEMFQMIFGGRYLLLLMAIFSTYIGVLYNDCFGLMVGAPSGQWKFNGTAVHPQDPSLTFDCLRFPEGESYHEIGHDVIAKMQETCRNTFGATVSTVDPKYASGPLVGVDSAWAGATNRLDFYNSFKMKQAVILGVVHMILGVCHSFVNLMRKRDMLRIYTMFIPEVVFLLFTFGWMDFLIIVKWLTEWKNTSTAPSLLAVMTSFFLAPGGSPNPCFAPPGQTMPEPGDACYGQYDPYQGYWYLFAGQYGLQVVLILCALIAVPTLLFPIPCIEYFKMKNQATAAVYSHRVGDDEDAATVDHHAEEGHEEGHDFTEIVIHQMIHTIEYVLGCVSNTASYLRLWALSLAHAQLAEVFWDFTMAIPLESGTSAVSTAMFMFFGWAAWFVVTLGVLLGMEGLGAFLHALRLHWVEFQNKFYGGDGIAFIPLSLPATA